MKFDRFRGAALAATAVLLISGAGTALAGSPPAPRNAAGAPATEPAGGVDKDTLQEGDQSTPDLAGAAGKAAVAANAPESENATEAAEASGTETDGPGGHEDAAGQNVDYQFDGEQ